MKSLIAVCAAMMLGVGLTACGTLQLTQNDFKPMPIERPASEQPSATKERSTSKIHVELGTNYLDAENLGTALDEARVSVAWDKTYPPAYLLLGRVYASLDQTDQAFDAFHKALELAPYDPDVNSDYGWFLCNQKREKEGIYRLGQAVKNPYYRFVARANSNLGICYLHLKDDAAADQAFRAALAQDDSLMRPRYQLAEIALRGGNYARARQYAEELSRRLEQDTPDSLWLMIRIERKLGNEDNVRQLAGRLVKQFPASEEFRLYSQGKFE